MSGIHLNYYSTTPRSTSEAMEELVVYLPIWSAVLSHSFINGSKKNTKRFNQNDYYDSIVPAFYQHESRCCCIQLTYKNKRNISQNVPSSLSHILRGHSHYKIDPTCIDLSSLWESVLNSSLDRSQFTLRKCSQ